MMTTKPVEVPKHEAPPKAPPNDFPVKMWQWDGSTDRTTWPDWLTKHSVTADDHGLKLHTPAGILTAVKGEHISEDGEGQLHVTKTGKSK